MKGKEIVGTNLQAEREYQIKTYDFKRPDKFSMEQIRTLSILHETFARLATTYLCATLRSLIEIHVKFVDQATFQEFINTLPNPTPMAVVNMHPLHGDALLQLDPPIVFSTLDRLYGGAGNETGIVRDLSDIEQSVYEGVIIKLLGYLRESWGELISLSPSLGQIETNPVFAQIVPPTEMTVIIGFDVQFGDIKGEMKLCIPYLTIEPLIGKLSAQYWYTRALSNRQKPPNAFVGELPTNVELCSNGETLSLTALANLKKDSTIRLEDWDEGKAYLRVGGVELLPLERKGISGEKTFTVNDTCWNELDIDLIGGPFKATMGKEMEVASLITKPLEEHMGTLKNSIENLEKKISEINTRQDEILDQLYFTSPDKEIPSELMSVQGSRLFSFITSGDRDFLSLLLEREHPQLTALVLSHLDSGISSYILSRFPEDMQSEIIERIAALDSILPEVLEVIDRVIKKKLKAFGSTEESQRGGVEAASEILNRCTRGVEKSIIKELERKDPDLAVMIKHKMFVFEDIVILGKESIQKIFDRIDKKDFLLAMKTVEEEVKNEILNSMNTEERASFESEANDFGRIRLSDVEAAQQRIISIIREMEGKGEIVIARPDEAVE